MSNRKEMPKQAFSGKLKKRRNNITPTGSHLAIKWKDTCDVFFLTTAHEDVFIEAPLSRGAHHKIKPAAMLDYKNKTGADRSDQILSPIIHFEGRNKVVEETFLSSIQPGSGQCTYLAKETSKKKMSLEIFYEKSAEGLLTSAGMEFQVQGQTSSPAG
jgi:hypothetical protein